MPQQSENIEKMPPQNLEAEKSLLGGILIDKEAIVKVVDILRPEDFYNDHHGIIFDVMLKLYTQRSPIDIITVTDQLERLKQLDEVGGASYLASLASGVTSASHIVHYAKIIQSKSTLRRLISTASGISEMAYSEKGEISDILDKAEQNIFKISQKYLKQEFVQIKDVLAESFDRIDDLHKHKGKLRGVPTGFSDLDNILAGLQPSDLLILAARPSIGKTSLALNIATYAAVKGKIPVGIFSLEMSKEQVVDRLICSEAGVDSWKLRTGNLSDEDFPKIGYAMGVLSEAPIFIDDSPMLNVLEIRTKARRLQAEQGLGLVVVDYLQLMEGGSLRSDSRVQEVSEISRSLKALARELNVPVLALSQLSRAVEMRSPKIPQLADLRESGSIEQDADVVMFIYREDYYNKDTDRKGIAEILIRKHRNGPTGDVELFFVAEQLCFRNLEKKREVAKEMVEEKE